MSAQVHAWSWARTRKVGNGMSAATHDWSHYCYACSRSCAHLSFALELFGTVIEQVEVNFKRFGPLFVPDHVWSLLLVENRISHAHCKRI